MLLALLFQEKNGGTCRMDKRKEEREQKIKIMITS
jgi:hypothetical protein